MESDKTNNTVIPVLINRHYERFAVKAYECPNCYKIVCYENKKNETFYCVNCGKKLNWWGK